MCCAALLLQTYAATALVVVAVLNRLPIKLLPGQRGTGRRHSAAAQVQVRLLPGALPAWPLFSSPPASLPHFPHTHRTQ